MEKNGQQKPIILASKSPFRAKMLENCDIKFIVQIAQICERSIEENLEDKSPSAIALALAKAKALEVSKRNKDAYVIGADQILAYQECILHKVSDLKQAIERMKFLSGKTHHLHTSFTIAYNGKIIKEHVEIASLKMRQLSTKQCQDYAEERGKELYTSVGCYKIETKDITLFEEIKGDYFSIIGLPLLPLLNQLYHLNVIKL